MKKGMFLALVLLGLTIVAEEKVSQNGNFKPAKLGDTDAAAEFQEFLEDNPKAAWKIIDWMNKPEGIIEIRDGKLFMQSNGAPFTGINLSLPDPRGFFVTPGEKVRITVTAKGDGQFGYWAYGVDKKYIGKQCTGRRMSGKEMKKYSAVFTVGEGVAKIRPFITAAKNRSITIESVQIEVVR